MVFDDPKLTKTSSKNLFDDTFDPFGQNQKPAPPPPLPAKPAVAATNAGLFQTIKKAELVATQAPPPLPPIPKLPPRSANAPPPLPPQRPPAQQQQVLQPQPVQPPVPNKPLDSFSFAMFATMDSNSSPATTTPTGGPSISFSQKNKSDLDLLGDPFP